MNDHERIKARITEDVTDFWAMYMKPLALSTLNRRVSRMLAKSGDDISSFCKNNMSETVTLIVGENLERYAVPADKWKLLNDGQKQAMIDSVNGIAKDSGAPVKKFFGADKGF